MSEFKFNQKYAMKANPIEKSHTSRIASNKRAVDSDSQIRSKAGCRMMK